MLEKKFFPKNPLKGSIVNITESVTPKRIEVLKNARLEHGFTNLWTSDGKILYKSSTENKVKWYHNFCSLYAFYFFWGGGDGGGGRVGFLFLSFSLFQNICFNDSAPLISNIFIKNLKYSTILNL